MRFLVESAVTGILCFVAYTAIARLDATRSLGIGLAGFVAVTVFLCIGASVSWTFRTYREVRKSRELEPRRTKETPGAR